MKANYKFYSSSKVLTPRQTSLYQFFKNKYKVERIYSKRKNIQSKLLDILFNLIKLKLAKNSETTFIVGNNDIFITLLIKIIFPKSRLIKDIGYFSFDIKELSIFRNILYLISDFISIIICDLILFESESQILRFSKNKLLNLFSQKFDVFYSIYSESFQEKKFVQSSFRNKYKYKFFNSNKYLNINEDEYFLFRGKFNYESGIDKLAKYYINCLKHNNNLNIPFFILGNGPLLKNLLKEIELDDNKNILFIREYLSDENLSSLIKNSDALFGQFNLDSKRLRYTLPNKFFEAMLRDKPYITAYFPSFKFLEQKKLIDVYDKRTILDSNISKSLVTFYLKFGNFLKTNHNSNYKLVLIRPKKNFKEKILTFNKKVFITFGCKLN